MHVLLTQKNLADAGQEMQARRLSRDWQHLLVCQDAAKEQKLQSPPEAEPGQARKQESAMSAMSALLHLPVSFDELIVPCGS